jgi:PAS domain S-box-containing protein
MATSIKHKIRLGTFFLFLLLVLTGGLSIYYLSLLKTDAGNILKDNYNSVEYCHKMQQSLDSLQPSFTSIGFLEAELIKQEKNITEPGELQATQSIRKYLEAIKKGAVATAYIDSIKPHIQVILSVNMKAIERKNKQAESSAENASTILIVITCITLIIGLTFAFNFPSVLTNPIRKLTEAIKEISQKNYEHRIHITSKDEFGELASAFNTMSERLQEFESSNLNKIIFEKARAEAVINSLKDATIGIDANDKVLFANEQALQLLGLKPEETVGKKVVQLTQSNDLFRFLLENDGNAPFKIVVEGKENFYTKELVAVHQGETKNKVIVLKNITSFKELDVAKTNFIATVSHELKTPLASSDFSLKLLEDARVGTLSTEQKELVEQLKSDNQRMLKILSELLNLGQVETGKIQLDIKQVNPYSILQHSLASVASSAKEKQITIQQHIKENLRTVRADADKASWVLTNFLTNAIKFSSVQSSVQLIVQQSSDGVSFIVEDKGPGIAKEYQHKIFERYFQVPNRLDKKGSGIGLAICKEFIEAMNGSIWVNSDTNEGSSFGFELKYEGVYPT